MLEANIKEQLKTVFGQLEGDYSLSYDQSTHLNQGELLEMLSDVASTSPKIKAIPSGDENPVPRFSILKGDTPVGISFRGIPGGHEFTSLVLAILNSDGKGKMPDGNLIQRIKNLKGSVRVRTYVSLSCENCPEVVQALNLMATLHSDFQHEMIDGSYAQDEVEKLGIQGVPSIFVDEKLVHSGMSNLGELLEKLEAKLGSQSKAEPQHLGTYELVVVGGGPAGVSAAIYGARKGLKTALLADKIGGQMQFTKGIENFVSIPYTEGPQLSAQLLKHISDYPINVFEQRRVEKVEPGNSSLVRLSSGEELQTQTLVIATGAKWRELNVPGEREYVGRGVAYCPHCDGPFYKEKRVAVVGGGNSGIEAAIDLSGIAREVLLFEYQSQLKADEVLVNKMKSLPNVSVILNAETKQIIGDGRKVTNFEYRDRATGEARKVELDGVFVQIGLIPNTQFLKGVIELNKMGEIMVDEKGRTNVPGIYAAGDVTTTPYKQIVIAMGDGAKVALAAFEDRMYSQGA